MPRPSQALLTRERIAEAALQLVDERGDFTVGELARRLGVQAASLYHHVDGRAGIIELLRAAVARNIPDLADDRPWDEALVEYAHRYRQTFAEHPHAVPLLATAPIRDPASVELYEDMVALLERSGFPLEEIMTVVTAYDNLIIGAALDLAAPDEMWPLPPDGSTPRLAAALRAQPGGSSRADRAFAFGLSTLIEGMRRLRSAGPIVNSGIGPARQ